MMSYVIIYTLQTFTCEFDLWTHICLYFYKLSTGLDKLLPIVFVLDIAADGLTNPTARTLAIMVFISFSRNFAEISLRRVNNVFYDMTHHGTRSLHPSSICAKAKVDAALTPHSIWRHKATVS